jgi:hypothetical protein
MCINTERWRRRGSRSLFLPLIAIVLLAVTFVTQLDHPNPATADESAFRPLTESEEAYAAELEKSADEISVRELNECHRALLGRMVLKSPSKLLIQVSNAGIVCTDKGDTALDVDGLPRMIGGLRAIGSIGSPLMWYVTSEQSSLVIFSLSMTVRKTDLTVAECPLKKRTLYVNIDFVDENGKLTEKRDDLGGVSILEFVKRLEQGPSYIEKTPE